MRRLVLLSLAVVVGVLVAACGAPDSGFSRIDPSEDGFGLSETSTTTSTTTTTIPPSTSESATTSTSVAESTTSTIPSEPVTVYYPSGRQLAPAELQLAPNPSLYQVMALILKGPPEGELYVGMRSILPDDAEINVENVEGVAVVDFPAGLFDDMPPNDQRLVFGQIVLTMTSQRGVGQVRFRQAGADMSVYLGNAGTTEAGQLVTKQDYTALVDNPPPPIDTTTSTTTTTTTAPTAGGSSVPGG
jgi:spore germination protein GerM